MAERYAFTVEWLDPHSMLTWQYILLQCPSDNTVEVYDPKNKRAFLKRTVSPDVKLAHLHIGAVIVLFARSLRITGFADEFTQRKLTQARQSAFCVVLQPAFGGRVLAEAQASGSLVLANAKLALLSPQQTVQLLGCVHLLAVLLQLLVLSLAALFFCSLPRLSCTAFGLTSLFSLLPSTQPAPGPLLGFEFVSGDGAAVAALRQALAPLGAAVHVSPTPSAAVKDADFFFSAAVPNCARGSGTSLALVKPHAVLAGAAGPILDVLLRSFSVTGVALLSLDRPGAAALLEVYKGVSACFELSVEALAAGPSLALELAGGDDVVQRLREAAGPADPELGRILRPASLRARFGVDTPRNALHVTDLEEDARLEVGRIFFAAK